MEIGTVKTQQLKVLNIKYFTLVECIMKNNEKLFSKCYFQH